MGTRKIHIDSLVCERDDGVFSPEEQRRYEDLRHEMQQGLEEIRELTNGYSFRVTGDTSSILAIAEWITLERRCCSFFDFELEVEPQGGPVWVRQTGGEGVKEFLQTEIAARRS